MQSIFKEVELNEQLHRDGYVVISFLDEEEVARLKEEFRKLHPEEPGGFYASSHVQNQIFRKQVNDCISAVFSRALGKTLLNVQELGGAFISKAPGPKGILPLHQDWNIVDETSWRSYNIWVPLVDVSECNGAVMVLKGSHSKKNLFRGPNIPPILSNIEDTVLEQMELLPMSKGQALIYDHALWHASPLNNSNDGRLVAVYGIAPKGAAIKFYYLEQNMISEYNASADFYLYDNPQEGPKNLELNHQYPIEQAQLRISEFYEIFGDPSWELGKISFVTRSLNKLKWMFGR